MRERNFHRARDVDKQHRVSGQTRGAALERAKHGSLKSLLPLWCAPRSCQKPERQNSIRFDGGKRRKNMLFTYACSVHVAQVAQKSQRTKLSLDEQPLPYLPFVAN